MCFPLMKQTSYNEEGNIGVIKEERKSDLELLRQNSLFPIHLGGSVASANVY